MTVAYFDRVKAMWDEIVEMMQAHKITWTQYKRASELYSRAILPDSKPADYHFFRVYVNQLRNGVCCVNC